MKQKGFFQTKAGGLTIAFVVIMVAFFVVMAGLNWNQTALCAIGFAIIVVAMLYSPFKVYLLDHINTNKNK